MLRNSILIFIGVVSSITAYAQAGLIDSLFGTNGVVSFYTGGGMCLSIQPDDKIVIGGGVPTGGGGLMRLMADGKVDSAFALNGIAPFLGSNYYVSTVLQPDGKILVGTTFNDYPDAFMVMRYLPDGSLDNTFGAGGKKKVYFSTYAFDHAWGTGIAVQADGKIVQVGIVLVGTDNGFGIVRYNANGTLDNSFGSGGKLLEPIGNNNPKAYAVAIQPDGKILVSGSSTQNEFAPSSFAVMRLNTDGSLDGSFGTGGKVTTYFGGGAGGTFGPDYEETNAYDMVVQPDGKIVLAGGSFLGTNPHGTGMALARYNADGSLDNTFGDGGKVLVTSPDEAYEIKAVVLQPDGKVVATGIRAFGSTNFAYDYLTSRFLSDGTLDTAFGDSGKMITVLSASGEDAGYAVGLQSTGKIVSVGTTYNGTDYGIAAVRYLSGLEVGVIDFENLSAAILIYPNPINTTAILNYELTGGECVTIDLVDLQGKLVQTFIDNEKQQAGKHEQTLHFNEQLPPGHYILRIGNGTSHQGVKIIKQ